MIEHLLKPPTHSARGRLAELRNEWRPVGASRHYGRPGVGDLIAMWHTVWRVESVAYVPLRPEEREKAAGRPQGTPRDRKAVQPYLVVLKHAGGPLPDAFEGNREAKVRVPWGERTPWWLYPGQRWPSCSCCREPMPCRTEGQELEAEAAAELLSVLESRQAGQCWACGQWIDPRAARDEAWWASLPMPRPNEFVTYWGTNLDLPLVADPMFHSESWHPECVRYALAYERRWLAADPRRPRVLTYPACSGLLIVHREGGTQCVDGLDGCGGLDDCDHERAEACDEAGCSRGCRPYFMTRRPAVRPVRRPRDRPTSDPVAGLPPLDSPGR